MAFICILRLVTTLFLLKIFQGEGKVPAIIVFGDSSVDSGNNNYIPTILRGNYKPYGRDYEGGKPTGRFCNGRIPPDFMSEAVGLRPTVPAYLDPLHNISDFTIGVNFASAGTGYDTATSDLFSVISIWKQLAFYKQYQDKLRAHLGDNKANTLLAEAMYLLSFGTNDFMLTYYFQHKRRSQYNINQYQVFLIDIARKFVSSLYGLGARKISLAGLPPMGCLPLERTKEFRIGHGNCRKDYNDLAVAFNEKLESLVFELNKELPGIRLVFANPYNILDRIIQKPHLYGFEEVAVGCCGSGMFQIGFLCNRFNPSVCKDAKKFVFWDFFHPTEKTNRILSEHLMKNVHYQFL